MKIMLIFAKIDLYEMIRSGKLLPYIAAVASALILAISCSDDNEDFSIKEKVTPSSRTPSDRHIVEKGQNLMLLYSAGYNTLSTYLQADIKELAESWLPGSSPYDNILLVFSRHTKGNQSNFTDPVKPVLERIYRKRDDTVVRDTLNVPGITESTIASDAGTLNLVLKYIKDNFNASSYGMVFSSHATGWLPKGYYTRALGTRSHLHRMPPQGGLMTKTIGEEHTSPSYEIDVSAFASAFPDGMDFDYILFDACLMGCVEVAYELRDACRQVAFSQAEVLAEGFDYTTLSTRLLKGETPDIEGVCKDFYDLYNSKTGEEHSATISLVNTSKMERLAAVCRDLFSKYRSAISALDYTKVQGYFGGSSRWFFDLEDILVKAGISEEEKAALDSALSECIIYKGCTGQYYSAIDYSVHTVDSFCGLSMYLPACGNAYLNNYYKGYLWNDATGLVQ